MPFDLPWCSECQAMTRRTKTEREREAVEVHRADTRKVHRVPLAHKGRSRFPFVT